MIIMDGSPLSAGGQSRGPAVEIFPYPMFSGEKLCYNRPNRLERKGFAMERLDKLLAATGRWSRKEAKALVKAGRVRVAGVPPQGPEDKVTPGTPVTVDGRLVETETFTYLMPHKPAGVVSATEDSRDKTVLDLPPRPAPPGPFPRGAAGQGYGRPALTHQRRRVGPSAPLPRPTM